MRAARRKVKYSKRWTREETPCKEGPEVTKRAGIRDGAFQQKREEIGTDARPEWPNMQNTKNGEEQGEQRRMEAE